jgi:hypothetical protein
VKIAAETFYPELEIALINSNQTISRFSKWRLTRMVKKLSR